MLRYDLKVTLQYPIQTGPSVNAKSLPTRKWEALKTDRGKRACLTSSESLPGAERLEFPGTGEAGEGLGLSVHRCSSKKRKGVRKEMRQTQEECGSWVERRLVRCWNVKAGTNCDAIRPGNQLGSLSFPHKPALLGRSHVAWSGRSGLAVAAGSGKEGSGGGGGEGGDFDEFHVFGID